MGSKIVIVDSSGEGTASSENSSSDEDFVPSSESRRRRATLKRKLAHVTSSSSKDSKRRASTTSRSVGKDSSDKAAEQPQPEVTSSAAKDRAATSLAAARSETAKAVFKKKAAPPTVTLTTADTTLVAAAAAAAAATPPSTTTTSLADTGVSPRKNITDWLSAVEKSTSASKARPEQRQQQQTKQSIDPSVITTFTGHQQLLHICCGGQCTPSLFTSGLPGLCVNGFVDEGLGQFVTLPLHAVTAEKLASIPTSPFPQSQYDVHQNNDKFNIKQFAPSQYHCKNNKFDTAVIKRLCERICVDLHMNASYIKHEKHKMLVQQRQSVPHSKRKYNTASIKLQAAAAASNSSREDEHPYNFVYDDDDELSKDVVAQLFVFLPGVYTGGRVSARQEMQAGSALTSDRNGNNISQFSRQYSFSTFNSFDCGYLCHYTTAASLLNNKVYVEIEPITTGSRIILIYNLIHKQIQEQIKQGNMRNGAVGISNENNNLEAVPTTSTPSSHIEDDVLKQLDLAANEWNLQKEKPILWTIESDDAKEPTRLEIERMKDISKTYSSQLEVGENEERFRKLLILNDVIRFGVNIDYAIVSMDYTQTTTMQNQSLESLENGAAEAPSGIMFLRFFNVPVGVLKIKQIDAGQMVHPPINYYYPKNNSSTSVVTSIKQKLYTNKMCILIWPRNQTWDIFLNHTTLDSKTGSKERLISYLEESTKTLLNTTTAVLGTPHIHQSKKNISDMLVSVEKDFFIGCITDMTLMEIVTLIIRCDDYSSAKTLSYCINRESNIHTNYEVFRERFIEFALPSLVGHFGAKSFKRYVTWIKYWPISDALKLVIKIFDTTNSSGARRSSTNYDTGAQAASPLNMKREQENQVVEFTTDILLSLVNRLIQSGKLVKKNLLKAYKAIWPKESIGKFIRYLCEEYQRNDDISKNGDARSRLRGMRAATSFCPITSDIITSFITLVAQDLNNCNQATIGRICNHLFLDEDISKAKLAFLSSPGQRNHQSLLVDCLIKKLPFHVGAEIVMKTIESQHKTNRRRSSSLSSVKFGATMFALSFFESNDSMSNGLIEHLNLTFINHVVICNSSMGNKAEDNMEHRFRELAQSLNLFPPDAVQTIICYMLSDYESILLSSPSTASVNYNKDISSSSIAAASSTKTALEKTKRKTSENNNVVPSNPITNSTSTVANKIRECIVKLITALLCASLLFNDQEENGKKTASTSTGFFENLFSHETLIKMEVLKVGTDAMESNDIRTTSVNFFCFEAIDEYFGKLDYGKAAKLFFNLFDLEESIIKKGPSFSSVENDVFNEHNFVAGIIKTLSNHILQIFVNRIIGCDDDDEENNFLKLTSSLTEDDNSINSSWPENGLGIILRKLCQQQAEEEASRIKSIKAQVKTENEENASDSNNIIIKFIAIAFKFIALTDQPPPLRVTKKTPAGIKCEPSPSSSQGICKRLLSVSDLARALKKCGSISFITKYLEDQVINNVPLCTASEFILEMLSYCEKVKNEPPFASTAMTTLGSITVKALLKSKCVSNIDDIYYKFSRKLLLGFVRQRIIGDASFLHYIELSYEYEGCGTVGYETNYDSYNHYHHLNDNDNNGNSRASLLAKNLNLSRDILHYLCVEDENDAQKKKSTEHRQHKKNTYGEEIDSSATTITNEDIIGFIDSICRVMLLQQKKATTEVSDEDNIKSSVSNAQVSEVPVGFQENTFSKKDFESAINRCGFEPISQLICPIIDELLLLDDDHSSSIRSSQISQATFLLDLLLANHDGGNAFATTSARTSSTASTKSFRQKMCTFAAKAATQIIALMPTKNDNSNIGKALCILIILTAKFEETCYDIWSRAWKRESASLVMASAKVDAIHQSLPEAVASTSQHKNVTFSTTLASSLTNTANTATEKLVALLQTFSLDQILTLLTESKSLLLLDVDPGSSIDTIIPIVKVSTLLYKVASEAVTSAELESQEITGDIPNVLNTWQFSDEIIATVEYWDRESRDKFKVFLMSPCSRELVMPLATDTDKNAADMFSNLQKKGLVQVELVQMFDGGKYHVKVTKRKRFPVASNNVPNCDCGRSSCFLNDRTHIDTPRSKHQQNKGSKPYDILINDLKEIQKSFESLSNGIQPKPDLVEIINHKASPIEAEIIDLC